MSYEKDIKRIEKKVDLLFKLCFKSAENFTFGSYSWEEIKESIPLFNISAKKVDIKDFPTEEEIEKYMEKIEHLIQQGKLPTDSTCRRTVEKNRLEELFYDSNCKLTGREISQKIQELKEEGWDEHDKQLEKEKKLGELFGIIEWISHNWYNNSYGGLKENIEKNYEAQFINDMLKKLGLKRRIDDCAEYIGKAIQDNKQLKEIFKKIDNYS